eukprot:352800-Chlamydomonas_euryale.AAC.4
MQELSFIQVYILRVADLFSSRKLPDVDSASNYPGFSSTIIINLSEGQRRCEQRRGEKCDVKTLDSSASASQWIRRNQPAHTPPQRTPGAEGKGDVLLQLLRAARLIGLGLKA